MKIYNTVTDYLKEAKPNDKVIFGGRGIIDGLKNKNKANTYTVKAITYDNSLILRAYKGRINLRIGSDYYDQQVMTVSSKEFKELPVY